MATKTQPAIPQPAPATSSSAPPPPPRPHITALLIIVAVIILVAGISIGVVMGKRQKSDNGTLTIQPTFLPSRPANDTATNLTAGWATYTNTYWDISFKYPGTLFEPCPDYTTEKEGVRFWESGFGCPDGHDIVYKMALIGYDSGKYAPSKKPIRTETVTIGGMQAQKNTYSYDESDGPGSGIGQSVSIIFTLPEGIVTLDQLGTNPAEQEAFSTILSTVRFGGGSSPGMPASSNEDTKWKTYTYTEYGFSFTYPPEYTVEERDAGFLVVVKPGEPVAQAGISIDARTNGSYATYENAKRLITTEYTLAETKKQGGWEIFQGTGNEGMLKGVEFRFGIAPYKTGVIAVETLANSSYAGEFDQILSTFTFASD